MSELTLPPLSLSQGDLTSPTLLTQALRLDQSLYLQATARWRDSRQGLHELIAQAPGVRDSINAVLNEHLQIDTRSVGLGFLDTAQDAEHFISLTEAWAFICQFPDIDANLDTQSTTLGLARHRLANLTPVQLLKQLKALNLEQRLRLRWNTYWATRAPGTPRSRLDHAVQLYRQHLEASSHAAYALGHLSATQLEPLQTLLDPGTSFPGDIHQLALQLPDQSKVKLPGAWVISTNGAPALAQTLYLPSRQPSLMVFSQRSEMEQWLTAPAQQLIPPEVLPASVTFSYTPRRDDLAFGIHDVLAHVLTAQLESLRNRHRNGSNLARYARRALDDADRLDRQRRENPVFTLPPTQALAPGPDDDEQALPFGNLNADITLSERWASIKQQRLDLERYLGDDTQYANRLAHLKGLMQAQDAAELDGNTAAGALLGRRTALERLELRHKPNAHYDALYQAQLAAVRAEAAIQQALKQISDDEHRLLLALLDHPAAVERRPEVTAARLTLTSSAPDETAHELQGLLVITRAGALTASAPHSLLLYWPGSGGGLQRFESRLALEQLLFKLPDDASSTLQWTVLSGDPFEYSLQQRLYASEQQAAETIMRYPLPALAHQRDEALDKLHEQTLSTLQIPTHQARELAYAHLLEQQRSARLAGALPRELSQLPADARQAFKALIQAQIDALHRAQHLLERDLEPFEDFGRRRLNQRLREDFRLEHDAHVQLNLPDSVSWEREYLDQYAGPGTPFKTVLMPSARRRDWSLLQLAQQNIDADVEQRLGFRQVNVTSHSPIEAEQLKNGLTVSYLKQLVTELDLAGAYEHLITRIFLGDPDAPIFTRQHQRECLTEPLRLMLILQGKFAHARGWLDDTDLLLLNNALEARQPFVLLPAQLSAGGTDTDHGPSGLFGITFIQAPASGRTLLYLPDTPDGQPLRRYASLERARKALYDRSLASGMSDYLAGRAIKGDAAAHLSRIAQAQQKNFDGLFEVGTPWPATTSLPEHVLNNHMGRLIEAHRATSRSNAALLLEHNALRSGMIFNYLKIALGLVPFAGAAIALYDAWSSANLAVAAFLRGDVGHGLAEVEAVLLSLIDCAMDILPGNLALPANARAVTRQRQLRHLGARPGSLSLSSVSHARRMRQRFEGYDYEGVVSLAGLQPYSHGPYRNVYRHGEGDFILRRGRIYKVERLGDGLDWRLSPTRQKTYKQPIALDESGEWDTHYGVYGTAFNGGLAGGGGVLGRMVDVLEPMWPLAIRERLPRWLVDRTYYRQRALVSSMERTNTAILRHKERTHGLMERYESGDMGVIPGLEKELADGIELNARLHQNIGDLALGTYGNKVQLASKAKSDAAYSIAWNSQWQARIKGQQVVIHDEAIDLAVARLDTTPYEQRSARAALREQVRARQVAILELLRQLDSTLETLNSWIKRVTLTQQRQGLTTASEVINRHLSARRREQMKVNMLLGLVDHRKGVGDASWHYLQGPLNHSKNAVHRALYLQANMIEVSPTQSQRNLLLNYCVDVYAQMRGNLNRWSSSYHQHFDAAYVQALIDELNKMSERARNALTEPVSRAPAGGTRRIFETDDQTLLIGVEHVDPVTRARRYTLTGAEGRTEIWEQGANGRFHLTNPAPVAPPVRSVTNALALINEARARLNAVQAYIRKVEEYARQNMLPVDLEEMLAREADELLERARTLGTLAPQDPILAQLRTQAASLITRGRDLRVRQTLASRTPTEGYLDYLREQQLVEIRKGEPARNLNAGQKGRSDYLQEYLVWDVSKTPQQVLWYAHFHYDKAGARFDEFIKAHLKTLEQRNLGLQWQRAQAETGASVDPIWRGNIGRPLANRHFAEL